MATTATEPELHPDRMTVERIFARAFVIVGGAFWVIASIAADLGFKGSTPLVSARNALIPLLLTVLVLAVGWFYERIVAYFLVALAAAVVVWGVVAGWELGVWLLMVATLIAPMLISAVLFYLAARNQSSITRAEDDVASASGSTA